MPDIIVVDGALPDMSAVEFIRRVRAVDSPIKPQIAVCLTEVDIGAIMRAKRAGAQGYLLKPFNRPQLLDRFRNLQSAA
jgi:two-component system chemotaxis response regulator CheY